MEETRPEVSDVSSGHTDTGCHRATHLVYKLFQAYDVDRSGLVDVDDYMSLTRRVDKHLGIQRDDLIHRLFFQEYLAPFGQVPPDGRLLRR